MRADVCFDATTEGDGWDANLPPARRYSKVKGQDTPKDTPASAR
jgi:hypothetical protein